MIKKYYHGSKKLFPIGLLLEPQRDGYTNQEDTKDTEAYFESRRPADKTPRSKSVFLVSNPDLIDAAGGYIDVIYTVKPISAPEESDLAWYSEAYAGLDAEPPNMDYVDHCVDRYWDGTPFPDEEMRCPEYRVKWAEVKSVFELNADKDDLEHVGLPELSHKSH